MDSLERSYLAFHSAGIVYLVPLSQVERIVDKSRETDISFVDFTQITDGNKREKKAEFQYGILLNFQKSEEESVEEAGIAVEHIEGILEIEEQEEFPLSKPVLNDQNEYLRAAVRIYEGEDEILAFLLDLSKLRKALMGQVQQTDSNHSQGAEDEMEPDCLECWGMRIQGSKTEDPQYITLLRDGQTVYIDRDAVTAVVMRPAIQRVPGTSRSIQGISFYEKKLVVYYNPFVKEEKEEGLKGQIQSACGVIFRTKDGKFAGLSGEATGEAAFSLEDADDVMSLGNGVWVKKRD